jgi:hypothetical protein
MPIFDPALLFDPVIFDTPTTGGVSAVGVVARRRRERQKRVTDLDAETKDALREWIKAKLR